MTRTPCCIPGCRRTTAGQFEEWICGKHWRAVPKPMKRRLATYRRKAKRDRRWVGVFFKMWERCKKRAIEEAFMGVEI